jgi:hypothetical protein
VRRCVEYGSVAPGYIKLIIHRIATSCHLYRQSFPFNFASSVNIDIGCGLIVQRIDLGKNYQLFTNLHSPLIGNPLSFSRPPPAGGWRGVAFLGLFCKFL